MTNATQSPARGVEVTQADREAAASFYQAHLARAGEVPVACAMRVGHIDESPLIQAFARHRLAHSTPPARPEDGSGEVGRLREALRQVDAAICDKSYFAALQTARAALAIKGGE